jgi:hypothetical protein
MVDYEAAMWQVCCVYVTNNLTDIQLPFIFLGMQRSITDGQAGWLFIPSDPVLLHKHLGKRTGPFVQKEQPDAQSLQGAS